MSCCAGLNTYIPLVVPPTNSDGPSTSVANMAAKKTIYLTGTFNGEYIILGSHDNIDFVPIVKFNGNGNPQSAKLNVDATLNSISVRRNADASAVITVASKLVCSCAVAPTTCCPIPDVPAEETQSFVADFSSQAAMLAQFDVFPTNPGGGTAVASGGQVVLTANPMSNPNSGSVQILGKTALVNLRDDDWCFCDTAEVPATDLGSFIRFGLQNIPDGKNFALFSINNGQLSILTYDGSNFGTESLGPITIGIHAFKLCHVAGSVNTLSYSVDNSPLTPVTGNINPFVLPPVTVPPFKAALNGLIGGQPLAWTNDNYCVSWRPLPAGPRARRNSSKSKLPSTTKRPSPKKAAVPKRKPR
jgi:hypothetical protein